MEKLVICPWCGKAMELKTECDVRANLPWAAWFECPKCNSTSPGFADLMEENAVASAFMFKDRLKQPDFEKPEPCSRSEWPSLWEPVLGMTAEERLKFIWEVCLDWDGARSAKHLGELLDEITAYCAAPMKENKNRPLTREEAQNLPVGTVFYAEHKSPYENDCALDHRRYPSPNLGDGYGRVYRYWLKVPTQEERAEFEWE